MKKLDGNFLLPRSGKARQIVMFLHGYGANGDDLLYDVKTNTFAVVTKAGAPRTMFKPRDGATYWRQQLSREQARSNAGDKSDS